ncbi:MAG: carbamoyltransferase HypF [Ruminiclostridium sp.]|nr:carbamoyltransferase HypF [Ruminiclostridium sp.]
MPYAGWDKSAFKLDRGQDVQMTWKAYTIDIYGIVQGVGFRPFIYKLANQLSLSGYVSNTSKGVSVFIEAEKQTLNKFIDLVNKEKPDISMIDRIDITEAAPLGLSGFSIEKSEKDEANEIFVSADLSICSDCKKDILDERSRRFEYSFTTCTYCGPRYSVMTDIPYDRVNTVMDEFTMCKECQAEYDDPDNRRFHSQPNACPACGPQLFLFNTGLQAFEKAADPIDFAAKRIAEGKIIALKGLGGYLLCCDATDNQAVTQLRQRKLREAKPFAVMCRDMEVVKEYCYMSEAEQQLVLSPKNPIVLLERRQNTNLAGQVSTDNNFMGVMLPYTPLHILLMRCFKVLVMTSANISDTPIIIDDEEAKQKISKISDFIIKHNRKIKNRVDDSVYKVINGKSQAIRRARGFVP